jgi:hypothetical protein
MDAETLELLRRGVLALEKLAGIEKPHEKRPAVLSTAIYDREEREREKRRKAARIKEQEPPRPPAPAA